MAIYTYVGNAFAYETASRIIFSTGRDMVIGEQLDLTAQEITEVGKVASKLNIVLGSFAVTITSLNFPVVQVYSRVGTVAVAGKK